MWSREWPKKFDDENDCTKQKWIWSRPIGRGIRWTWVCTHCVPGYQCRVGFQLPLARVRAARFFGAVTWWTPPPVRSFSFLINHHCQSPNLLAHSRDHLPVMATNVENTCDQRSLCPSQSPFQTTTIFFFWWSTMLILNLSTHSRDTKVAWLRLHPGNPPIHENAPGYKYIPVPRSTPRAQQRNRSTSSNLWCTWGQIPWGGKNPNCSYRKRRSYQTWKKWSHQGGS